MQGFKNLLNIRPSFVILGRAICANTVQKKLVKSEFRKEKLHKCQFKNFPPNVGNIWVFRKTNLTDLVDNNKKY